jgi:hypothetical protein
MTEDALAPSDYPQNWLGISTREVSVGHPVKVKLGKFR